MDHTNPAILSGIMKAVRKQGCDADTVAVNFASVEEMKKLPALLLHVKGNTFESDGPYDPEQVFARDPDRPGLLIEVGLGSASWQRRLLKLHQICTKLQCPGS